MKLFSRISLAKKISLGFAFLGLALIIQGLLSLSTENKVSTNVERVTTELAPTISALGRTAEELNATASRLGFYLLSKEEDHRTAFLSGLAHLAEQVDRLANAPTISENPNASELVGRLKDGLRDLTGLKERLLDAARNDSVNFAAMGFASRELNPRVREVSQLVGEMVAAETESDFDDSRRPVVTTMHDLRYRWATVVNEMRLFLAFRAPAAKQNLKLYMGHIKVMLRSLEKSAENGDLLFEQEDALPKAAKVIGEFEQRLGELYTLHDGEKWRLDAWLVREKVGPIVEQMNGALNNLMKEQQRASTAENDATRELLTGHKYSLGVGTGIALIGALVLALWLSRTICGSLRSGARLAERIAEGNLNNEIVPQTKDEAGQLLSALNAMQESLRTRLEREHQIAEDTARVKSALDQIEASAMMVTPAGEITYVNQAGDALFSRCQADIKALNPSFEAKALLGSTVQSLGLSNDEAKRLLASDEKRAHVEKAIGTKTLRVDSNPVTDEQHEVVGYVLSWVDRTHEIQLEQEIERVVVDIQAGQLATRIDLAGKSGFFLRLARSLNDMVDVLEATFDDINTTMQDLAKGKLGNTMERAYDGVYGEVKDSINATMTALHDVVVEVRALSEKINTGATQIRSDNHSLSERSEEQASQLESTSSSMEEITSTVEHNSENTLTAESVAKKMQQTAESGGQVVRHAITAMQEVNDASSEIEAITGAIDDLAFQTNLLALNASVEAARAGSQGRGFAVVASEVRNLALRSAAAAKDINALVQKTTDKIGAGAKAVNQSGEVLGDIVAEAERVGSLVSEISAASREQATGINLVNESVTALEKMTQSNAALAVATAGASAEMLEQARAGAAAIEFFTLEREARQEDNAKLDFSLAKNKHLAWKARLRNFLDGSEELTHEQAVSHRHCDLGKWLYGPGLAGYGHFPEMVRLEQVHKEMHAHISEIIEAKESDNLPRAEAIYKEVMSCSSTVVSLLTQVERQAEEVRAA